MLKDREKRPIGEKLDNGTEIVGLEFFNPNGTRAGFEECAVEPGSGNEIVDQIRQMQKLGELPGWRQGYRDIHILVHAKGYTEMVFINELDALNSMNDGTFRVLRNRPCWIINMWGDAHPQEESVDSDRRLEWIPVEAVCLDLDRHKFIAVRRDDTVPAAYSGKLRTEQGVQLYDKVYVDGDETIVVDFLENFDELGLLCCDVYGRVRAYPRRMVEILEKIEN